MGIIHSTTDEKNNTTIVTGPEGTTVTERFFDGLTVSFKGENNILVVPFGCRFINCSIKFQGDEGFCLIEKTWNKKIPLNLNIWSRASFIANENCSFNGRLNCIASEEKSVILGRDTMFSFGTWIRTSDVHAIFDIDTKKVMNIGKDVILGDHVWIGQDTTLLKGTTIGSGAIVGLGSIVTKKILSNTINSGVPTKMLKNNICWDRQSMHNYSEEDRLIYEAKNAEEKIQNFNYQDQEENQELFLAAVETFNKLPISQKLEFSKYFLENRLIILP